MSFVAPPAQIAVQTGFIALAGGGLSARGRRFSLHADPGRVTTALVHVQIDRRQPLHWSPALRARTAAAILALGKAPGLRRLQVDFEVLRSERRILLEVLQAVRAGLPKDVELSMTALAAWCDTETWIEAAPVDEIVPMLFRMGPGGAPLKARLAAGGDFANPRCRTAYGVSTDAPLARAPAGRRVYLFSPRSWTARDYRQVTERMKAWPD